MIYIGVAGGQGGWSLPCDFLKYIAKRLRHSNRAASYSNKAVTVFREAVTVFREAVTVFREAVRDAVIMPA